MNQEEYLEFIEKHPKITTHGFGVDADPHTKISYEELFKEKREELKDSFQEFQYCCDWINLNPNFDGKVHAYHWKHRVQEWLEANEMRPSYIAQGVFILAAMYLGYKVRKMKNDTCATFGPRVQVKSPLPVA